MKKTVLHRLIGLVLTLVLLLSALPVTASAASASLTGSSTVAAGSTVTLTLSVSGSSIYGLTATLSCGSGLSVNNYGCSVSGWSLEANGNKFSVYGTSATSGAILTVTLKVSDSVGSAASLNASFSEIVASDGENDVSLGTASWTGTTGAAKRSDAKLYGITVANVAYSPAFNSDIFTYTATVPYEVDKVSLDYFRNNNGSTVTVSGNKLEVGENTITFKVVSEDGKNTNYYKVLITRQPDPNYKKSDDATLSELTLDAGALSPVFDPNITDYVVYVPFETKTVTATAAGGSKSTVAGTEPLTLTGEDDVITVTCTAEDGVSRKTYTVHVVRMPEYDGVLPSITAGEPEEANPCTCGAAEGEPHKEGCPLYVEPEEPMFKLPMTVAMPLVGRVSSLIVGCIALALMLIIVFLLGLLIGQPRSRSRSEEPEEEAYYDESPRPPEDLGFMEQRPAVTSGGTRDEEEEYYRQPRVRIIPPESVEPQPEEPVYQEPQEEPAMPREPHEDDGRQYVEDMSLDDLLRDIRDL